MIVFDLSCAAAGHVFEAWFGSTEDYESQKARGLVSCPMCGSADVAKAVMAPNVAPKGNRGSTSLPAPAPVPMANDAPPIEAVKQALAALAAAQEKALAGSNYVGRRFAEEARSMHLGETEERPIHGQATPEEARALVDEGVPVAPLPLPIRSPGNDH